MRRLYFVEPIVAIYAFASFLVFPLVQQYVYRRLWQDLTNSSYPVSDNSSRCGPTTGGNHSNQHEVSPPIMCFFLFYGCMHVTPGKQDTLVVQCKMWWWSDCHM